MECAACHASLPDEAIFCLRCGAKAPDRPKPEPEDPIRSALRKALGQQYEIQHLLGKGGMGAVYLATEAALEREVAIKVLPPDRGATKDSRDRFRREARTAAKLSHPNIVPLHTFGDVDGTLYFVMGYVKGESLAARLKREGRIPVEEARRILIEIAEALDYAHKLGVIHRDIKPDNVLLEEGTGRALLTDFGVAKALGAGQTLTEVGGVLGTPQYMSPEQAQGKGDIDRRSDLYSLGVMGYAMLAGRLPFEGATPGDVMVQHITKEAPALASLAAGLPPEITAALTRCLAKDPSARWRDAKGLRDALTLADDEGPLPEAFVPLWRWTQVALAASWADILLLGYQRLMPPKMDPLDVRFLADEAPGITITITVVAVIGVLVEVLGLFRMGHTGLEMLQSAVLKPAWWFGFYPTRLRGRSDVWSRLPVDLRRGRSLLFGFVLWFVVVMVPFFVIVANAQEVYRRTGEQDIFYRLFISIGGRGALTIAFVPILLLGLASLFLSRAKVWAATKGASVGPRHFRTLVLSDTGQPSNWRRPEIAALLLPIESGKGPDTPGPAAAPELARTIAEACRSLSPGSDAQNEAVDAARALAAAIAALDAEIASLASNADPAERERLQAKLVALGPAPLNEAEPRRQMRELLQKQLDLLRGFESRLEGLKAGRAKRFELLRALWRHAIDLRAAANDPARGDRATGRIRALCAEITQHLQGREVGPDPAMSDAPTIER